MAAKQLVSRSRRSGFTLIEILIVVLILGILAGIVIAQFSNATTEARENTLREDLRYLRSQMTVFAMQHRDVPPGYPGGDPSAAADEASFLDQMTKHSDEWCTTSSVQSSVYCFGPYLSKMPTNPLSGQSGIWIVTGAVMPDPDESQPFGWIYNPEIQRMMANLTGHDAAGNLYRDY